MVRGFYFRRSNPGDNIGLESGPEGGLGGQGTGGTCFATWRNAALAIVAPGQVGLHCRIADYTDGNRIGGYLA